MGEENRGRSQLRVIAYLYCGSFFIDLTMVDTLSLSRPDEQNL